MISRWSCIHVQRYVLILRKAKKEVTLVAVGRALDTLLWGLGLARSESYAFLLPCAWFVESTPVTVSLSCSYCT